MVTQIQHRAGWCCRSSQVVRALRLRNASTSYRLLRRLLQRLLLVAPLHVGLFGRRAVSRVASVSPKDEPLRRGTAGVQTHIHLLHGILSKPIAELVTVASTSLNLEHNRPILQLSRLAFGLCRRGGESAAGRRRWSRRPHLKKSAKAPIFFFFSLLLRAAPALSFALAITLDTARAARAAAAIVTTAVAAVLVAAVVLLVSFITCVVVVMWR